MVRQELWMAGEAGASAGSLAATHRAEDPLCARHGRDARALRSVRTPVAALSLEDRARRDSQYEIVRSHDETDPLRTLCPL